MELPKGSCSVCAADVVLTKRGTLRSHPPYPAPTCPGSNLTPEGTPPAQTADEARAVKIGELRSEISRLKEYQNTANRILAKSGEDRRKAERSARRWRHLALSMLGDQLGVDLSDVPQAVDTYYRMLESLGIVGAEERP